MIRPWRMAFVVGLLGWGTWAGAVADISLLKEITGTHPLLSADTSYSVGGSLTVIATPNQVGITTQSLKLASQPAPLLSYVGDSRGATLATQGDSVVQEYSSNGHSFEVVYQKKDGYLVVQSKDCGATGACETHVLTGSLGKAPGTAIIFKDWANQIKGNYKIRSAGGESPKDINSIATIDVGSDPTLAIFWMPYCLSNSLCDPGESDMPYASAAVYESREGNQKVYRLFVPDGASFRYYAWVVEATQQIFKNFQYSLSGQPVSLEHVLAGPQ